jgi:hypothetical protein
MKEILSLLPITNFYNKLFSFGCSAEKIENGVGEEN